MIRFRAAALAAVSLCSIPARVPAQVENWDPGRIQVTRQDLMDLLQRLEQAAQSDAYSDGLRARSRKEAALIRTRLEEGDFQVGDRIGLVVENEQQLTDTFTVKEERVLSLPVIGDVPLKGVLRAELEPHLTRAISRYVRDPVVHARSLIRVSILGEVPRPGFYLVPTDMVITDALMQAGGPATTSNLTKIRIERGGERLWEGEPLQRAIAEGRTLDQLSLQAGDRVVVPKLKRVSETGVRTAILILSIPAAIFGLTRLFP